MTNTIYVRPGKYSPTDFSTAEAIRIEHLTSCVAVATFAPEPQNQMPKATLAHLTVIDDIEQYYRWLDAYVESGSQAFIAGGLENISDVLVGDLRGLVTEKGLRVVGEDLFNNRRRSVTLYRDGTLEIEYRKWWWRWGNPISTRTVSLNGVKK